MGNVKVTGRSGHGTREEGPAYGDRISQTLSGHYYEDVENVRRLQIKERERASAVLEMLDCL